MFRASKSSTEGANALRVLWATTSPPVGDAHNTCSVHSLSNEAFRHEPIGSPRSTQASMCEPTGRIDMHEKTDDRITRPAQGGTKL